jgi:hypothetical protein
MAENADTRLERALDKNSYNDAQLITIKQPTNLPYYQNSKDFKRLEGEIIMNGVIYRYVKCRIYNDSLEMLCIPNLSKMSIEKSRDEFAKIANDFQQGNTKKKASPEQKQTKAFSIEYEIVNKEFSGSFYSFVDSKYYNNTPVLSFVVRQTLERPPSSSC